ncbi:hypothetical protein K9M42_02085 [Patescibacteria group bacterium]|nr:hypothetical protein [Patescibacteria group bacterium]
MKKAIFIIILVFVIAISYILITSKENEEEINNETTISSFEDCVLAGNPIMESYPRQCMDGDNVFVEEIENEIIEDEENLDEEVDENNYDEKESLLRTYLDENISELSPEEAVLGGTFFITSLTLNGENEFVVEYEDGHIALIASGEYSIDEEDNVNIQEFNILENEEPENEELEDEITETEE